MDICEGFGESLWNCSLGCVEGEREEFFFSFHIALPLYTDAILHSDTQGDNYKRYRDSELNCLCCCWTKFSRKPTLSCLLRRRSPVLISWWLQ